MAVGDFITHSILLKRFGPSSVKKQYSDSAVYIYSVWENSKFIL